MKNLTIFYLTIVITLFSCSSTKSAYWNIPVPSADPKPVSMVGKSAGLTESERQSWAHSDLFTDSIPGFSLIKAYQFLEDKKSTTTTVGIIDSGIDISHEDITDMAWTNPKEIPGNNKDDDGNKYVDDVHGWNFLGGAKGEAIYARNELTRLYGDLKERFDNKAPNSIGASEKADYEKYLKLKTIYNEDVEKYSQMYELNKMSLAPLKKSHEAMVAKFGKKDYSLKDVQSLPKEEQNPIIINLLTQGNDISSSIHQIENEALPALEDIIAIKYNLDYRGRKTNDDVDDLDDMPYGNPWVIGSQEKESHGTHVAGIMLGNRSNNNGIKGVFNNVKLIAVRAIPNGDEHDKDVALAIRYMADNGAKVVNMSFGKNKVNHPEWLIDAIKYAESKDVLLVRAAGNDGVNIDDTQYYPNDASDNINEYSDNVITVGALNPYFNEKLVGDYSNYGKINVDIFAPGSEIYSTVPTNSYGYKQGTSMASPAVAGIAAMIRSYYPQLSAKQVKHIILNSGLKIDMKVLVPKSGGKETIEFSEMSKTGRIVNAYNAVRMADQMVKLK